MDPFAYILPPETAQIHCGATGLALFRRPYLPYLWLREGKSPLLLIPAALSLALFAWLLTLHPTAVGRVYAAYGAVYVSVALVCLRIVEGVPLTFRDLVGSVLVLAGMGILMGRPSVG
ncbi:MAG: hypothetical protein RLZZ255_1600 [Cyanobacteriota bacterium]